MQRIILLILFVSSSINATSQMINLNPNRVYLEDGTILEGEVDYLRKGIKLKQKESDEVNIIDDEDIIKIVSYTNGKRNERIKAKRPNSTFYVWVNLLVKGENSLYAYIENHPHGGKDYYEYFFKKEDSNMLEFLSTSSDFNFLFRKRASRYFKDCLSALEKIAEKEFTKKNIKDLFIYYNNNCGSNK